VRARGTKPNKNNVKVSRITFTYFLRVLTSKRISPLDVSLTYFPSVFAVRTAFVFPVVFAIPPFSALCTIL